MKRAAFDMMPCPIARSLERVGEWWSMLILGDAFTGVTRFDDFQKSLGIASNMLTRRLGALVKAGMLAKRQYQERPPRYEYVLTARGDDFRTVLLAFFDYGNRHFAPEGESFSIVDAQTGARAEPVLVDGLSGRALMQPAFRIVAGPAATSGARQRLTRERSLLTSTKSHRDTYA